MKNKKVGIMNYFDQFVVVDLFESNFCWMNPWRLNSFIWTWTFIVRTAIRCINLYIYIYIFILYKWMFYCNFIARRLNKSFSSNFSFESTRVSEIKQLFEICMFLTRLTMKWKKGFEKLLSEIYMLNTK